MSTRLRTLLLPVLAVALIVQSVCTGLCAMGCAVGSCPVQGQAATDSNIAACCDHEPAEDGHSPFESGSADDHHSNPVTPCALDNALAWIPESLSIKPLIPAHVNALGVADVAAAALVTPEFESRQYAFGVGSGPPLQFSPSSNSNRAPPAA